MKKNQLIKMLTVFFIAVSIVGCTKRPSESDIFNIVNKKFGSDLVISIDIKNKGSKRKINDIKVFAYTLGINYIQGGLSYGYVSGCPERHCCKDEEYLGEFEYLIGKDKWNKWRIYDFRTIYKKKIGEHWRPESKSKKEFYKYRISN